MPPKPRKGYTEKDVQEAVKLLKEQCHKIFEFWFFQYSFSWFPFEDKFNFCLISTEIFKYETIQVNIL